MPAVPINPIVNKMRVRSERSQKSGTSLYSVNPRFSRGWLAFHGASGRARCSAQNWQQVRSTTILPQPFTHKLRLFGTATKSIAFALIDTPSHSPNMFQILLTGYAGSYWFAPCDNGSHADTASSAMHPPGCTVGCCTRSEGRSSSSSFHRGQSSRNRHCTRTRDIHP
jgi:hypothetical protein